MAEPSGPNLGAELTRIHTVVTRSLDVAIDRCQVFAGLGWPDADAPEGLLNYVRCLESFLGAHHTAEDEVLFPNLGTRLPEAPFARLKAEHLQVEELLAYVGPAVDTVEAAVVWSDEALRSLAALLERLRELWRPHIQVEEAHFGAEVLGPLLPPEEHARLARLASEHSQKNSGPDYLVLPFLLYNLAPEERAFVERVMPPVVTQELVPVTWADRWASMKPFLLV